MANSVLEFIAKRRSHPANTLKAPYPSKADLNTLLALASRVPDHGQLVPWRFIVMNNDALTRVSDAIKVSGPDLGMPPEKIVKASQTYANAGCAVVVVFSPKTSAKVLEIEQRYAAGGVCLQLVNAALATGWGAGWVSGAFSHNAEFAQTHFGIAEGESIAGIVHLGTGRADIPDRVRPDIENITTWASN